jgi:hypothetical protein
MAKAPANMAKSVKDRLLNIARKEGRAFDVLLVRFALERCCIACQSQPIETASS